LRVKVVTSGAKTLSTDATELMQSVCTKNICNSQKRWRHSTVLYIIIPPY